MNLLLGSPIYVVASTAARDCSSTAECLWTHIENLWGVIPFEAKTDRQPETRQS